MTCLLSTRHKGFTLIELLIVVAIIAILAAIAVPNFLEAQTRAKVSRVRSDLRTIATALESYRVDNNRYPPTPFVAPSQVLSVVPDRLSTPISYISSSSLIDPFIGPNFGPFEGINSNAVKFTYSFDGESEGNDPTAGKRFFYLNLNDSRRGGAFQTSSAARRPFAGEWEMASLGPNRWRDLWSGPMAEGGNHPAAPAPFVNNMQIEYDPTNGTISDGNIIRSQAGSDGYTRK